MYFLAMAVSSETRPSSVPGAEIRRGKKARLSNSCTRSCKESSGFDEIKLFCKDFNEGFTGFKVPAGCGRSNKDLWVDKYAPRCLEELAVHKKKEECSNRVLLISGQAGVGKSATIHVIASHLEATVCEWNMPTPTIWQEHLHNSNSADSADKTCTWEELQLSLQSAGACKVAFNPITVNSIKKTLSKICREEQCKLTADQIDLIAKSSGGDIRQAITSLQYFCLKSRPKLYAFPTVLPLIQKKDHMGSIVWMMGFLYHLAEMKLFLYFCTTRGRLRILLHWVCTDGTHNFRY